MSDDPQKIQDLIKQQNEENYQDGSDDEPMDIEEVHEKVYGEAHHTNESLNTAEEINQDEQNRGNIPPIGSDVVEDEE